MDSNAVVSVYPTHTKAEEAIDALRKGGYDVKKLSIVGKDYHTEEHVVGFYNTGERVNYWGKFGAFWGAVWGFLMGAGLFFIPGVGPVVIAGPLIAWIVGALEGALVVGGLSALGAALYSIGIPKDSILEYEQDIRADKFVVVAHGTAEEVEKARAILETSGALRTNVYDTKHEAINPPAPAAQ
jgi:hypothetical protein